MQVYQTDKYCSSNNGTSKSTVLYLHGMICFSDKFRSPLWYSWIRELFGSYFLAAGLCLLHKQHSCFSSFTVGINRVCNFIGINGLEQQIKLSLRKQLQDQCLEFYFLKKILQRSFILLAGFYIYVEKEQNPNAHLVQSGNDGLLM